MIDLTWTAHRFVCPPPARQRILVLVDRTTASVRLLQRIAPVSGLPPASLVWLWVVTPGAVVSWGGLLAESGDRNRMLLAALGERMEEALRYLTPIQYACATANIPCQIHILHGVVAESVVRLARTEGVDQVLLVSAGGTIYGQSCQELAMALTQRLSVPVGVLDEEPVRTH